MDTLLDGVLYIEAVDSGRPVRKSQKKNSCYKHSLLNYRASLSLSNKCMVINYPVIKLLCSFYRCMVL